MVERVARALSDNIGARRLHGGSWEFDADVLAKIAVSAMREPTGAMVVIVARALADAANSGLGWDDTKHHESDFRNEAHALLASAIDAALGPKPTSPKT